MLTEWTVYRLDVQATVRVFPAASVSRKHPGSFRRAQTICPAVAKTSLEALEDEGRAQVTHKPIISLVWKACLFMLTSLLTQHQTAVQKKPP